jgi:pimeloyl-ACP methyl ester carboxylesterase
MTNAFSKPTRRDLLVAAAAAGASTGYASAGRAASEDSSDEAIRPFRVEVPDKALIDLRRRIAMTRWPDRETVPDESQGVQLGAIQEIARYWGTDYDWRKCEAKLNALPQFITTIDGLDIHFIHVRSKHESALPLIVTHGWPGSVIEQLRIIGPLTDPVAYGASASDAFHLVIPSIPGYGFSARPTTTGWGPERTARAWTTLMKRLGYTQFVAQGGDVGAGVSEVMALQAPPELLGIHVNFPGAIPPDIAKALQAGDPPPAGLSADERRAYGQLQALAKRRAYSFMMTTRPQTLYGLTDSPVSLAAWMLDHGDGYGQPAAAIMSAVLGRTINGHPADGLTRDEVLDDITLYWLTNTGISAARFYWESAKFNPYNAVNVAIPAAVTVFPGENYQAPRSWAERAYQKLIYFNEAEKGGHYAAWEQPKIFSAEIRAAFKSLRPRSG